MTAEETVPDYGPLHLIARWIAGLALVGAGAVFLLGKMGYLGDVVAFRGAFGFLAIPGGVHLAVSLWTKETHVVHRRLIRFDERPFAFLLTIMRDTLAFLACLFVGLGILG